MRVSNYTCTHCKIKHKVGIAPKGATFFKCKSPCNMRYWSLEEDGLKSGVEPRDLKNKMKVKANVKV